MVQEQLGAILAVAMGFHQGDKELVGRLVEVTRLRDELVDWACGGAALAQVNGNHCTALEKAMEAINELVQLTGSNLHEQALGRLAWIRDVMAHGVRHGATVALAITHLCPQPEEDLHAIEPGFPSWAKVPKDIDIKRLIPEFSVTTNATVPVVKVEQVIKDTPR